jgi:alkaline phosphatase D
MKKTFRDGVVTTSDADGHSIHLKLKGLQSGREYWYQFYVGDDESPVGRTRTSDRRATSATIALATCQHYETGHFAAYRDMAEWAPDCVIHVGDYLYEGGTNPLGEQTREMAGKQQTFQIVRQHNGAEITTLWDYRNRYALYRMDKDLQAAHAASPWIVAMDDHEIDNNWAGYIPQDPWAQTTLEFQVRRMAALKAYYEHMPLERPPVFDGMKSRLDMHGVYRFGSAQVHLLDTRQYRSDQVCDDGFPSKKICAERDDAKRSMTGAKQEKWLFEQLDRSDAAFNVLAQQTWFAPFRYSEEPSEGQYNMDQWDGYTAQRQRIIDKLADVSNPVVLSGDWHCANAARIHKNPLDVKSALVGHEFAATSISSNCPWAHRVHSAASLNPHVVYVNGDKRGYLRSTVTQDNWKSEFRTVTNPLLANSAVTTDREINTKDS